MRALKVGDPMDPETELGPLATEQILQGVDEQVQKTIAQGAKLLTGGNRIHGPGFFYEPTVLVDVPKESPRTAKKSSARLQLFSASAMPTRPSSSRTTPHSAWVRAHGPKIARSKNFLRRSWTAEWFSSTRWLPRSRLPFGGVKRSGFGRELGAAGIREFTNTKTIWIS